jgi:hypothetical protein
MIEGGNNVPLAASVLSSFVKIILNTRKVDTMVRAYARTASRRNAVQVVTFLGGVLKGRYSVV